jgi:hypothetical protein
MMGLPVPMREENYHRTFNKAMDTERRFSIISVVVNATDFASLPEWDC